MSIIWKWEWRDGCTSGNGPAWWRSENVLDRRYHGHHCFDMNLGHMAVAVEQRIRLTAMVADAAPPSLGHAMRCHEVGRGRRQLLAGTGASLDHRTHRLLFRPGHGGKGNCRITTLRQQEASRSNSTGTRSTDTRYRYFEQQHRSLIPLHTARALSPIQYASQATGFGHYLLDRQCRAWMQDYWKRRVLHAGRGMRRRMN